MTELSDERLEQLRDHPDSIRADEVLALIDEVVRRRAGN